MVEVDMLRAELHSALMVDIEGATRVYYTERDVVQLLEFQAKWL